MCKKKTFKRKGFSNKKKWQWIENAKNGKRNQLLLLLVVVEAAAASTKTHAKNWVCGLINKLFFI